MRTDLVCPYCGSASFYIWQPCLVCDYKAKNGEIVISSARNAKTHDISPLRYECCRCSKKWVDQNNRKTINELAVGKLSEGIVASWLEVDI